MQQKKHAGNIKEDGERNTAFLSVNISGIGERRTPDELGSIKKDTGQNRLLKNLLIGRN